MEPRKIQKAHRNALSALGFLKPQRRVQAKEVKRKKSGKALIRHKEKSYQILKREGRKLIYMHLGFKKKRT